MRNVGESVSLTTTTSQEQSQGVANIHNAIKEMGSITQSVSSNSEHTAMASEQLAFQAQRVMEIVGDLTVLVQGR